MKKRLASFAVFTITLLPLEPATATPETLHPLETCSTASFADCFGFQQYWDTLARNKQLTTQYNCTFLPNAKSCWPEKLVSFSICTDAPKLNFVKAHDALSTAFRSAIKSGDLDDHPNIVRIWEHLNAFTMDLLYGLSNKDQISADARKLTIEEAPKIAEVLWTHFERKADLVEIIEVTYNNANTCGFLDDVEQQLGEKVRAVIYDELKKLGLK
jgi:hypothetical protein